MIARDAEPIAHRPPYKRIDLAARRRPLLITREEVENGIDPDITLYDLDFYGNWHLKL